jgi:peptidoglycan hydrolase-like protein with peptidoglycan-binding domain
MRLRRAIPATLALLLAAECGVSAASGPAKPKSAGSKASGSAAGGRAKKSSKHSKRRERGQKAPTPDRISEIQQALAKDGSFAGTPNGKWDNSSVEAIKKFQAGHGLNPSGKLDALTLQKLGLGSQTAGVAAPMPPDATSLMTTRPAQTAQRQ